MSVQVFSTFDGKDLDRYSMAVFIGEVNMYTQDLSDIMKVQVMVDKMLGQPRACLESVLLWLSTCAQAYMTPLANTHGDILHKGTPTDQGVLPKSMNPDLQPC